MPAQSKPIAPVEPSVPVASSSSETIKRPFSEEAKLSAQYTLLNSVKYLKSNANAEERQEVSHRVASTTLASLCHAVGLINLFQSGRPAPWKGKGKAPDKLVGWEDDFYKRLIRLKLAEEGGDEGKITLAGQACFDFFKDKGDFTRLHLKDYGYDELDPVLIVQEKEEE